MPGLQEFFHRGKLNSDTEQIHRQLQLRNRRIRRSYADIAVTRVFLIRESSARTRQSDAGFLAQRYYTLCAAVHNIHTDKIAAIRIGPLRNILPTERRFQLFLDNLELRLQNGTMLFHLQLYPIEIAKEVDMTELVQLIRADRLIGIMLTEYREVVLAGHPWPPRPHRGR